MGEHKLPDKQTVARITKMATECFKSLGAGQEAAGSIIALATKDSPAIFALGVDISEVVTMVLTMAGHQNLLAACKAMVDSHGMHGPCEENSCERCTAAYRKAKAAIENAK